MTETVLYSFTIGGTGGTNLTTPLIIVNNILYE